MGVILKYDLYRGRSRSVIVSDIKFFVHYRPTEFLPVEYAGIRGLEQRMYREQEALKSKTHKDVNEGYVQLCSKLATYDAIFFPVRVSLNPTILLSVSSYSCLPDFITYVMPCSISVLTKVSNNGLLYSECTCTELYEESCECVCYCGVWNIRSLARSFSKIQN